MSTVFAEMDDLNYEQVIKSQKLLLIDFWGNGCVPCKMIEPILDRIQMKYKDKIRVVKANISQCSKTAKRYNVLSIPTLILLKKGTPVERIIGIVKETVITKKIDENI